MTPVVSAEDVTRRFGEGDTAVDALRGVSLDVRQRELVAVMEQAVPGDDASTLPEKEAVAVAVALGPRLWQPAGVPFRSVHEFVPRWLDNAERWGEEGSELVPLAREIYADLGRCETTLVHGDFHHHNLLRHDDRWVAIDSKAMLGEPEYELWSFLNNPLPYTITLEDAVRRLAAFESVGLDQWRMTSVFLITSASGPSKTFFSDRKARHVCIVLRIVVKSPRTATRTRKAKESQATVGI